MDENLDVAQVTEFAFDRIKKKCEKEKMLVIRILSGPSVAQSWACMIKSLSSL